MQNKEILGKIHGEFEHCMPLFLALGDEARQQIVLKLICAGCSGLRVGELTAATGLSRPATSHHLKLLKNAGIISVRSVGTKNYYYLGVETTLCDLCDMAVHLHALSEQLKKENEKAEGVF